MAEYRLAQQGFCLLEVMLSIFLAGLTLLSLAALTYHAVLSSDSASLYAMAEQQAYATTELLRAGGSWQTGQTPLYPVFVASYTPQQQLTLKWYDRYSKHYASITVPCVALYADKSQL